MDLDDIRSIIDKGTRPLGQEKVEIFAAFGRIAGRRLSAARDEPPFDLSALDGYAVAGAGQDFVLTGTAEPFSSPREVHKGEALFVSTGAPIPKGTRFVVREEAEEHGTTVRVPAEGDGRKIWRRGIWLRRGTVIIARGLAITPPVMERLALMRVHAIQVYRKPVVSLISTGNELAAGRVPLSNASLLAGLIARDGGLLGQVLVARDEETRIVEALEATRGSDLVLLTGGTSAGKMDFTRGSLRRWQGRFLFESPPISPGKTTAFGRKGNVMFFTLPGNPQPLLTVYEVLVKRCLFRLSGKAIENLEYLLPIPETVEKEEGVTRLIPVSFADKGSAIKKMEGSSPDAFVVLGPDERRAVAGEKVRVVLS